MASPGMFTKFSRKPMFPITSSWIPEKSCWNWHSCVSLTFSCTSCGSCTTIEENKIQSSLQTPKYAENVIDRKNLQISCIFFPKIVARNWGVWLIRGNIWKRCRECWHQCIRSNAWLLSFKMFRSHSCCNAKIYGKTMLNGEIPVNRYQKKINHMSKLVETIFIILKC